MVTKTQHSQLTGSSLHEPKGVAAAVANRVYVSDGAGTGAWSQLPVTALASFRSPSPSAGIGYATGAGGAVTQITSITTSVTLNKICGTITTFGATAGPGVEHSFTCVNSNVAATDVVVVSLSTYGGAGLPLVYCQQVAAGQFTISVTNVHAANPLNDVLVINFAVIKSVNA